MNESEVCWENHIKYDPTVHAPILCLALAVVELLLAAITVLGNTLLLLTIYRNPRHALRTPPTYLIVNLGVADLLVGLVLDNLIAARDVYRYNGKPFPKAVDDFINIGLALTLFVSIYTILVMSVDRFVAVSSPLKYKSRVTLKVVKRWLAVIWASGLLMCLLPLTGIPFKTFTLIYTHTHSSLPMVVLTVLYVKIFRALKQRRREMEQLRLISEFTVKKSHALQNDWKMVYTILIILVLFYVCFLPEGVSLNVLLLGEPCKQSITFRHVEIVLSRLVLLNSALNPFVYAWRVKKYRRALFDCLKGTLLRQNINSRPHDVLPRMV